MPIFSRICFTTHDQIVNHITLDFGEMWSSVFTNRIKIVGCFEGMLFEHIFNQVTHYNYEEKGWENLMLVSQM